MWLPQLLRALAILLVFVDHFAFAFWMESGGAAVIANTNPLPPSVAELPYLRVDLWLLLHHVALGTVGVALFFLVSGFVIPMSLERYRPGRFLIGRALQIYPVWFAGLAVTAAALFLYGLHASRAMPVSIGTWLENNLLIYDMTGSPPINPVSWSLVVELKFYVLCAILASTGALRSRRGVLITGLYLTVAILVAWPHQADVGAISPQLQTFVYSIVVYSQFILFMLVGTCFYNYFRGHWSRRDFAGAGSILMVLMGATFAGAPFAESWKQLMLYSFGVAFLLFSAFFVLRARVRFSRVLNFSADISYPLYVVHYIAGYVLLTALYEFHPSPYLNMLMAGAVVVVLSHLVHRLVEVPSVRLASG